MKSKKIIASLVFTLSIASCFISFKKETSKTASNVTYDTVPGDPLKARIYTLDNGLKVYMTIYKNAPRIQTYIAIGTGSKNDPHDATGLSHYLEHMLFKGTDAFGTQNFEKEKLIIQKIEDLYEVYRKTSDEVKRKKIYHEIDSVSGEAAKLAIANEYDKMMASIGAQGTNAYTSLEQTVYVNDIPSNQLEKWLTIEANRFSKLVLRIFHTELEAVYEEKNRSLDNDGSKVWEALLASLWQKNTYGTQTTIGTIDHLKNPSLKKIREYFDTYYVPNNAAICLSGDFDPDEAIALIKKTFGGWKKKEIPSYVPAQEDPITKPIVKEVVGPDAENVTIGFRFKGAASKDADIITLVDKILFNGTAGLFDLNLNQQQKVLSSSSYYLNFKDYTAHVLTAKAKTNQKLEEVKDLLLSQIERIKKGDFPDWLLPAIITNMKLDETKMHEQNASRADAFVSSFITGIPWKDYVSTNKRLEKITKQELIDFVQSNYGNNYVVIYKRTGVDTKVQKVVKPEITPVALNRETESPFCNNVTKMKVKDIQPVFIDYKKDIIRFNLKNNIPVSYSANTENKTFDMYYILDMGNNNDKKLAIAVKYLQFLGTSILTPAQVKQEFYKLGCSFSVFSSEDRVYVTLSGLSENFDQATALFENLLANAQPNKEALNNLVADILKNRTDAKLNKNVILRTALYNYGVYGPRSPYTNILSTSELESLKPEELVDALKQITSYEHRILYYGPKSVDELTLSLNKLHLVPAVLKPIPPAIKFENQPTDGKVYVYDYDMKQAEVIMLSKSGAYDKANMPIISMFNEYFGSGMSSVVFQEIRESKALAYSVNCAYRTPSRADRPHYVYAYIGTQVDKLPEAMQSMSELMNNMPQAETNFSAAKENVIQSICTERITKSDILFNYENAKRLGQDYDIRKDIFSNVPSMTLKDINAFHEKYFKNQAYTLLVVGKKESLDMKTLEKYGKVTFVKAEEIFGY